MAGFLNLQGVRAVGPGAIETEASGTNGERETPGMTTFQKLKHEARRAEQRSDWARAIDLYQRALDADEDMADLSLFNRIGDLHMRLGQAEEAVACYERAVDRYADSGMLTSAIALCNKILRIAPSRVSVYRRLGGLHARTGLVAEGRANTLKYARHAVENGRIEDGIAAVEEFTDPTGDEEARLELAELLVEHGERAPAVAQLREVLRARRSRGTDTSDLRERIERLAPDDAEIETDGEPAADGRETASAPAGPVRLSALVADRLEESGDGAAFRADRVESDERTEPGVDEGLAGVRRILGAFREQVSDTLETSDPSLRYDLGVEFMTIGLLDEAIEEFRTAVAEPS
ncbi:MAG: tetratricopeptide repeat protein, partial [Gemmatimonadota bacterium]